MTRTRKAFLDLAREQRRSSWQHRKWAREEKNGGDPVKFHEHAANAIRLWREAKSSINAARNW
jgi:hypothetical protein